MDITTFFIDIDIRYSNDTLHTYTNIPKNKASEIIMPWINKYGKDNITAKITDSTSQVKELNLS